MEEPVTLVLNLLGTFAFGQRRDLGSSEADGLVLVLSVATGLGGE